MCRASFVAGAKRWGYVELETTPGAEVLGTPSHDRARTLSAIAVRSGVGSRKSAQSEYPLAVSGSVADKVTH
jgi:hypothetical protein